MGIIGPDADRMKELVSQAIERVTCMTTKGSEHWSKPLTEEALAQLYLKADEAEFKALFETFKAVVPMKKKDMPPGRKVLGSGMLRKIKRDGTAKSRAYCQGFSMVEGVDYHRTHSPTMSHASFRSIFAVAAPNKIVPI